MHPVGFWQETPHGCKTLTLTALITVRVKLQQQRLKASWLNIRLHGSTKLMPPSSCLSHCGTFIYLFKTSSVALTFTMNLENIPLVFTRRKSKEMVVNNVKCVSKDPCLFCRNLYFLSFDRSFSKMVFNEYIYFYRDVCNFHPVKKHYCFYITCQTSPYIRKCPAREYQSLANNTLII